MFETVITGISDSRYSFLTQTDVMVNGNIGPYILVDVKDTVLYIYLGKPVVLVYGCFGC